MVIAHQHFQARWTQILDKSNRLLMNLQTALDVTMSETMRCKP